MKNVRNVPVLVLLLLFISFTALAQDLEKPKVKQSLFLSLEPNFTFGNRKFTNDFPTETYITGYNTVSFGGYLGHRIEKNHLFGTLMIGFNSSQNGIKIDYEKSGFDSSNEIKYGNRKYSFGYGIAFSASILAGYSTPLFKKSSLDIGIGISGIFNPVKKSSNGVMSNTGNSTTGNFVTTYTEEITSFSDFTIGLDLIANYNFRIGKMRLFSGIHGRYIPSLIKGTFESFEGYPMNNKGTFEIRRSYIGINIGLYLFSR